MRNDSFENVWILEYVKEQGQKLVWMILAIRFSYIISYQLWVFLNHHSLMFGISGHACTRRHMREIWIPFNSDACIRRQVPEIWIPLNSDLPPWLTANWVFCFSISAFTQQCDSHGDLFPFSIYFLYIKTLQWLGGGLGNNKKYFMYKKYRFFWIIFLN